MARIDLTQQRIFNYQLEVESRQMIQMPEGAEILGVTEKEGVPFLLAAVDEEQAAEQRIFRTVTTGEKFNREIAVYVGTVRLENWYMMHVFEIETALLPHADPIDPRFQEDMRTMRNANKTTEYNRLIGKGSHLRAVGDWPEDD